MTPISGKRGRAATGLLAVALLIVGAAPAAAAPPRAADLIVPIAEVQAIVHSPELEVETIDDRTSPWVDHSQDPRMSAPCRHFLNQDEEFGNTWVSFRSAGYGGSSDIGIHQNIAVYPDADTAQQIFDQVKTAAAQCRTQFPTGLYGLAYTLTEHDPLTLVTGYPDTVNGPGSVNIIALRGQIIIGVGAAHFSTNPRIALTVLDHITNRIT